MVTNLAHHKAEAINHHMLIWKCSF